MRANRPAFISGGFYHIYNRGAHRDSIFREEDNYLFVLRKVKRYAKTFDLTLIAYCLMPNHYHLLARQGGEATAGLLPQRVFNSYSKAYNKRYGHSGTLFEGPYKARRVKAYEHLLHLCRCIHANPVKHGLVSQPEEWPYTNYPEWVGIRSGELVDRAFVQAHFPSPAGYREFVRDYLVERRLLKEVANAWRCAAAAPWPTCTGITWTPLAWRPMRARQFLASRQKLQGDTRQSRESPRCPACGGVVY